MACYVLNEPLADKDHYEQARERERKRLNDTVEWPSDLHV